MNSNQQSLPQAHPPSLTRRLTLFFALVAIIVFTGLGWLIEQSIEHHFSMGDDTELQRIEEAVFDMLKENGHSNSLSPLQQRLDDLLVGHHDAALHIQTLRGETLYRSHQTPDLSSIDTSVLTQNTSRIFPWHQPPHFFRVRQDVRQFDPSAHPYLITVAVRTDHHRQFLTTFRYTLWLMIILGIAIMSLMGWFAVKQGHAPLRHIMMQIGQTHAGKLDDRLDLGKVPKELTDLANSFNEMLERMEQAFTKLSNFSADIAHELRTPITNLLTQTQVALSKARDRQEYQEILYSNMEEYERMAQMVNDMLFLAKSDTGLVETESEPVEVDKEIIDLFEYYEAWAEEKQLQLKLQGKAKIHGDRALLKRAFANLINNAIKHTQQQGVIEVTVTQRDVTDIEIKNPGKPVDAKHLPHLFDRFYRADAARNRQLDGAGLGLAITKSIIELHGGKISVYSSATDTLFKVCLPTGD